MKVPRKKTVLVRTPDRLSQTLWGWTVANDDRKSVVSWSKYAERNKAAPKNYFQLSQQCHLWTVFRLSVVSILHARMAGMIGNHSA